MGNRHFRPIYFQFSYFTKRLEEQVFSYLERIAYDKVVDRYNVSRIVENDIWEKAMTEGFKKGEEKGFRHRKSA